ncbi:hypothetical protein [Deinococcus misasensis]|uniref:hypothetical protein n=1 Tax=Deinococcus misasensis TaxID=392413 RepID=UPI0005518C81|nr:hypothetical protein [Deinococcus misasensis]
MIEQFKNLLQDLWQILLQNAFQGFVVLLGVAVVLGFMAWLLTRVDRDALSKIAVQFNRILGPVSLTLLLGVVLWVSWVGLSVVRNDLNVRLLQRESATFSSTEIPAGGDTTQYSPYASYLQERTYTRNLVLPSDLLDRIGVEGAEILTPYLPDPSTENITRLQDQFRRSGKQLVLTREATQLTEEPIALEGTDIKVDLGFVQSTDSKRSYYNAAFDGTYVFVNPLQQAATARFNFPLPYGSGTLKDFQMTVNGQRFELANLNQGYLWEGEIAPAQKVTVRVQYKNQGSRTWRYELSNKREPIKAFKLQLTSGQNAKFQTGSLYPTSQSGNRYNWDLKNIITAQSIVLSFSGVAVRETLLKVFGFVPLSLLMLALWVTVFSLLHHRKVPLLELVFAVVGLTLAAVFGTYLVTYLAAPLAVLVACLLGAVVAVRALGNLYLVPALVSSFTPAVFLWTGNAGLVLSLLGMVVLLSLIPMRKTT